MLKKIASSMSFMALAGVTLAACLPGVTPQNADSINSNRESAETLNQAMMTGGSVRCQITHTDRGESISFVMKDQKMRVSNIVSEGQNQNSNMINDGTYMYIWNEGETTGFKSQIPSEEDIAEVTEDAQTNQQIPNFTDTEVQEEYQDDGYTVNCTETEVADSEFVPPTNVTFQDFSTMMDNAIEAAKRMQEAQ